MGGFEILVAVCKYKAWWQPSVFIQPCLLGSVAGSICDMFSPPCAKERITRFSSLRSVGMPYLMTYYTEFKCMQVKCVIIFHGKCNKLFIIGLIA